MKIQIFITLLVLVSCSSKSFRDASRDSTGIAPKVSELKEDIFIIYYARAFSWRGYFGVHPWMAWKKKNEKNYTVAQVTSWQLRGGVSSILITQELPDRKWFDSSPTELMQLRGDKASKVIAKVRELIPTYPHSQTYKVWPGPNSNTFVAYMIRNIDELTLELPPTAIGKDYFGPSEFLALSPSKTGFQFSAYGLLGLTVGAGEGIEVNLLGLHFGFDFWTPAIKLPFAGRLGFKDQPL